MGLFFIAVWFQTSQLAMNAVVASDQPTTSQQAGELLKRIAATDFAKAWGHRRTVGSVVLLTSKQESADRLTSVVEETLKRFSTHFGDMGVPGVVVDTAQISAKDTSALRSVGAEWVLPWPATLISSAGAKVGGDGKVDRESEAFDGLSHELGHLWFGAVFWPSQPAGTRPVGQHYGSDAPDWLDEAAAIVLEGDKLAATRRKQHTTAEFPSLREFLGQTHPGLSTVGASVAASEQVGKIRREGGAGAVKAVLAGDDAKKLSLYYSQGRLFCDFLFETTRDPRILARIARGLRDGATLDAWLAGRPHGDVLPSSVQLLEESWGRWCEEGAATKP